MRRAARVVGWLALLIVALGFLHRLAKGPLAVPPLPGWNRWIGQVGPAVATGAVLRLAAMAAGWYLLATTVVNVLLTGTRSGITQVVEAVTPRLVLRLLQGMAGATLAASVTTSMAVTGAAADDDPPVMRRYQPDVPEPTETVVMRRLPDEPQAVEDAEVSPIAAGTARTVQPGDHFWSIAESELVAARSRPVSDSEIDPYWRRLVAANLVEVPNPDLLFPGQVVQVPPVPPA